MGELLDVTQAAEVAGLSDRHMRRKLSAGEIPGAHKDGRGRWLVPEESAKAAGVLSPPLTAEEKALIAELKAEDEKTTAKEMAAKVNEGRKDRGERLAKKPAIDKFLKRIQKSKVTEEIPATDREPDEAALKIFAALEEFADKQDGKADFDYHFQTNSEGSSATWGHANPNKSEE